MCSLTRYYRRNGMEAMENVMKRLSCIHKDENEGFSPPKGIRLGVLVIGVGSLMINLQTDLMPGLKSVSLVPNRYMETFSLLRVMDNLLRFQLHPIYLLADCMILGATLVDVPNLVKPWLLLNFLRAVCLAVTIAFCWVKCIVARQIFPDLLLHGLFCISVLAPGIVLWTIVYNYVHGLAPRESKVDLTNRKKMFVAKRLVEGETKEANPVEATLKEFFKKTQSDASALDVLDGGNAGPQKATEETQCLSDNEDTAESDDSAKSAGKKEQRRCRTAMHNSEVKAEIPKKR